MTLHDTVHGFVVEREVPLPELDAVMYQMKHEKTGLELGNFKKTWKNEK